LVSGRIYLTFINKLNNEVSGIVLLKGKISNFSSLERDPYYNNFHCAIGVGLNNTQDLRLAYINYCFGADGLPDASSNPIVKFFSLNQSKPYLGSFELKGDIDSPKDVHDICPTRNEIIVGVKNMLYVYKIHPETNELNFVLRFEVLGLKMDGIECMTDGRVRLFDSKVSLVLDTENIIQDRFSQRKFIKHGDSDKSKIFIHKNDVIIKEENKIYKLHLNYPEIYIKGPLVNEEYKESRYAL
jgi:hypothetical protein